MARAGFNVPSATGCEIPFLLRIPSAHLLLPAPIFDCDLVRTVGIMLGSTVRPGGFAQSDSASLCLCRPVERLGGVDILEDSGLDGG